MSLPTVSVEGGGGGVQQDIHTGISSPLVTDVVTHI